MKKLFNRISGARISNIGLILGLLGVMYSIAPKSLFHDKVSVGDIAIHEASYIHAAKETSAYQVKDGMNIPCIAVLSGDLSKGISDRAGLEGEQLGCSISSLMRHHGGLKINTTLADPLADRTAPIGGGCDYRNLVVRKEEHILSPGVYCGGIIALSTRSIHLEPGVYTIKDGPLVVGSATTLSGQGVGFFFQGDDAVFSFGRSTILQLKAAQDGPMAGILFFEDRNARPNREFALRSSNADLLEGAIYLPRGRFVIETVGGVGREAEWTAVIAGQVDISKDALVAFDESKIVTTLKGDRLESRAVRDIAQFGTAISNN